MRLIVHMGLHKTASTWLQHLLNRNHASLLARGIWYAPQPHYPAHHHTAWRLLAGDGDALATMLRDAAAAGCHTVILSSEDLEGALFNPDVAALIDTIATAEGVAAIEWHLCLREPGAYFASLHAQLQHHVYADPLALLREAMLKGVIFIPEPLDDKGAPYWFYCFDADAFVGGFAARTHWPVIVHDYADRAPFPGWRMIDRLGALDALVAPPDAVDRNARLPEAVVVRGYVDRLLEAVPDEDARDALEPLAWRGASAGAAAVPTCAAIIGRHFAASHAAALARFAP